MRKPAFLARCLFIKYFDHFFAISPEKQKGLFDLGVPNEKISVIPNFVDLKKVEDSVNFLKREDILNELGIKPGSKVIVCVGRLIPSKKFDLFIDILDECAKKMAGDIVGLIIGEGEDRKRLESLARSLNRKNLRIIFLNYQRNIFKYLFVSDLFLFPSENEVLPMCLIEASAMGVPAVCSNIPANNHIVIDGETGFLARRREEYSIKALNVLSDTGLALRFSRKAQERARNVFDKQKVINDIVEIYKKELSSSGRAVLKDDAYGINGCCQSKP
jgi:glycosyltransferase involved in cell wall biosynthesis